MMCVKKLLWSSCFLRTTGRLILNEVSLVSAISPFARIQVVQFDGLSYREQVSYVRLQVSSHAVVICTPCMI